MGNCQAIDNASLVIQNPTTGKSERLYSNISAAEVMKLNPGHYVALLLTTTLYSSRSTPTGSTDVTGKENKGDGDVIKKAVQPQPLRITRIKLLRPTESLTVGHIYRLVTTQEVMKGLMAKKNSKISNKITKLKPSEQPSGKHELAAVRSNQQEKTHHQMRVQEKDHRRRTVAPANKPKGWHPSLNSISEASS
ncbi:DASH complex subunit DAD4 [Tanacetum coccineum]